MNPPRTSWTADELMAWTFPEPRWAVPGLLAEGANLLAGSPKIGKSWMALGLGVAVASGGKALGKIGVEAGDVLYLALEDTGRRLQNRLQKVLQGDAPPERLTLSTFCEPVNAGGAERIGAWLADHRRARLVIVDVLARIRGKADPRANGYEVDYAAVANLKVIADTFGVAFLIVHHVRKAAATDFIDEVSGTNGLSAAADATLVLKRARGKHDAELKITGRDVEEADYALRFAADLGAWQLLDGPAEDYSLGDTRLTILRSLRRAPGQKPKELAMTLGMDYELTKKTVARMTKDSQLTTDGSGKYFPIDMPVPGVPGVPDLFGDRDRRDAGDTCPDCGHPLDSQDHETTCEGETA